MPTIENASHGNTAYHHLFYEMRLIFVIAILSKLISKWKSAS